MSAREGVSASGTTAGEAAPATGATEVAATAEAAAAGIPAAPAVHAAPRLTASVTVPTRNRPAALVTCVRSVLAATRPGDEVVVVDQSDGGVGGDALRAAGLLSRLTYVPSDTRGVARARNLGVASSTGEIVLCTDDDCTVPPGWIDAMLGLFERDPEAAIVFATVVLSDVDEQGFGAEFRPTTPRYVDRVPPPSEPWGISANMAVRRQALRELGGFDESLGVGSRFGSAAETDLAVRAIGRGLCVVNADEPVVVHHGLRRGKAASALARGYAFGLGAAFMKQLRLRTRPGWSLLPKWLVHFGARAAGNVVHGRRPEGLGFLVGLVRGAAHAVFVPIDRRTGHFRA